MKNSQDISSLKVGDEVVVRCQTGLDRLSVITEVAEEYVVVDVRQYDRKTGESIGKGPWSSMWLVLPTQEIRNAIEARKRLP